MARKNKLNLDYFPHIISNGKKISYIRKKHGNDGYSTWFTILEELGLADFHYLDLRNEKGDDYSIQLMFLSERCYIEEEKLISIIEDLVKLGCFDKDLWIKKILWSKEFYDSVQEAWKRRDTKLLTKEEIDNLLFPVKNKIKPPLEIKSNELSKAKTDKFDFKKSLISLGVDLNIVEDWILVRKTKKATNTETSFKRLVSQIKKSGLTPNECITISVEKSWKGFEADWIKELNISSNGKSNRKVRTPEQREEEYFKSLHGEDNEQFICKSDSGIEDITFDDVE